MMVSAKLKTFVAVFMALLVGAAPRVLPFNQGVDVGKAASPAPQQSKPDGVDASVKAQLEAARLCYEMAMKDLGKGFLTNIEVVYSWSRRWMDAQGDMAKTRQDRIAAAEGHLKRMQDLEKLAPEIAKLELANAGSFPSFTGPAARYYRLEAESLLSESRK